MTCWAIIPVKGPDQGKLRLAGALDGSSRRKLVAAMLSRVASAVQGAHTIERLLILGPCRHGLNDAIPLLSDPGTGLNGALTFALEQARWGGASRVVLVAADLPQATPVELDLLARPACAAVAIAPDRHGTGTNAISLPLPAAGGFTFAFGQNSFAAHCAEAKRFGLRVITLQCPGLMRDIDVPEDLKDAAELLGE